MVHDLFQYGRAKKRIKEIEPHFNELCRISDYLFKVVHLPGTFDILQEIESQKIEYYIEINECKRILNTGALKNQFKPKLLIVTKKENNNEKT